MPYRTTKDNADFADFVREQNAFGILAAGGDGTFHAAVNICLKENLSLPLGILASGTSNDLATFWGLPVPFKACDAANKFFDRVANGVTRRMDVGKSGGKYFVNVASAGLLTSIAHQTEPRLKNALGKFAYYWSGLKELPRFKPINFKIVADGKSYDTQAFLFVIVNSNVVGSMKNISSSVRIDDGKLDLLAIKKVGAAELMRLGTDLFGGRSVDGNETVLHLQAKNFTVTTDENLIGDFDGEKGSPLPLVVETIPDAIEIFC